MRYTVKNEIKEENDDECLREVLLPLLTHHLQGGEPAAQGGQDTVLGRPAGVKGTVSRDHTLLYLFQNTIKCFVNSPNPT
jgi:hypothetical protein